MKKSTVRRRQRQAPKSPPNPSAVHSSNGYSSHPEAFPSALDCPYDETNGYISCESVDGADSLPIPPTSVDYAGHALPKVLEPEPLGRSPTQQTGRLFPAIRNPGPHQFQSISSAPEEGLIALPWILDPTRAHRCDDLREDYSGLNQTRSFQISRPGLSLQTQVMPSMSFLADSAGERWARLKREADQMREMLQAKERELAAINR